MMLRRWFAGWRAAPIATTNALREFFSAEAALVAQKCVIGYCHVKTRLPLAELMRDEAFRIAFEGARWEAFAAVLSDLAVVVEGHLRTAAGDRQSALADRLADCCAAVLAGRPRPAAPTAGWSEIVDNIRRRLHRAQLAAPQSVADISWASAERLFDTLPIHQQLSRPDKPAVVASVRFMLVSRCGRLERRLDRDALIDALIGGA
ncbi:MAG TPA: hypothetical protein VMV26_06965 [Alphaproteobacteria bacterium]|nr:hypothetical protein [Alphaproteobacteria bacterium]